jgi:iron complex outermembrane receptor protein
LRTNVTLFSIDHKDRQYITVVPDPDDATVLNQWLGNVAGSKVSGIEAEITYAVTEELSLDFSFGMIDSTIEKEPGCVITDTEDCQAILQLSNTPEMTMNIAANYLIDSDLGYFVVNGGYYFRDDYYLFEDSELLMQEGYGMLNLGVSWESLDGKWYGGVYGKNLTGEEYMVGGYNFVGENADGTYTPGLGGDTTLIAYYGDPQTFHVTVGYRF